LRYSRFYGIIFLLRWPGVAQQAQQLYSPSILLLIFYFE
jgi:hypothetical protein